MIIAPHSRTQSPSYARSTERDEGLLAKSITGYHKNMVRKQYPVLELANQMPVRIWIWPEPLVAPRVRRALGTRMIAPLNSLVPRRFDLLRRFRAVHCLRRNPRV